MSPAPLLRLLRGCSPCTSGFENSLAKSFFEIFPALNCRTFAPAAGTSCRALAGQPRRASIPPSGSAARDVTVRPSSGNLFWLASAARERPLPAGVVGYQEKQHPSPLSTQGPYHLREGPRHDPIGFSVLIAYPEEDLRRRFRWGKTPSEVEAPRYTHTEDAIGCGSIHRRSPLRVPELIGIDSTPGDLSLHSGRHPAIAVHRPGAGLSVTEVRTGPQANGWWQPLAHRDQVRPEAGCAAIPVCKGMDAYPLCVNPHRAGFAGK